MRHYTSVARDLREHIGKDVDGLSIIEWFCRLWPVLWVAGMGISSMLGRNHGILVLPIFFGSFMLPLAAYQWFPKGMRNTLHRHLKKETGGTVPDPDVANDDPTERMGSNGLVPLQKALNRHWAYHERQAAAKGTAYEYVRGSGPLRDVLLPLVAAAVLGWLFLSVKSWLRQ